jgi:Ni,Fe-hydrogenase III small subunit
VLSVTDAAALAPGMDGVILVAKPGVTRLAAFKQTLEQLQCRNKPKSFYCGAIAAIIVLCEAAPGCLPQPGQVLHQIRRHAMGEKGSKKDKNKADKQKQGQLEKKKEQQKTKLPAKKPA